MAPTLGGGTQDTDFNKGFSKGILTTNLRRRNGGGQGDPDPLVTNIRQTDEKVPPQIRPFKWTNEEIERVFLDFYMRKSGSKTKVLGFLPRSWRV